LLQKAFEPAIAGGHAFDDGQQVLRDVPGARLSVHLGRKIIGRIFEPFSGDGADEEIEVIDDLLGEPLPAGFKGEQAGHGKNDVARRCYTPIIATKKQDANRFFSRIRISAPKSAKLLLKNNQPERVNSL